MQIFYQIKKISKYINDNLKILSNDSGEEIQTKRQIKEKMLMGDAIILVNPKHKIKANVA